MIVWLQNLLAVLVYGAAVYLAVRTYKKSPYRDRLNGVFRQPAAKGSLIIVTLMVLFAFLETLQVHDGKSFLTYIYPFPKGGSYSPPSLRHWLGTGVNGYDVLLQILKGCKTSVELTGISALVYLPLGITAGLLAGYRGGLIDDIIQWIYTTFASIPWLLFVLAFLVVFGQGMIWIAVAIGLTAWVDLARLVRAETLKIKELSYIKAAKATGRSGTAIMFREVLPNVRYLILINLALTASHTILAESILTFIGIGVEIGTSSWGVLLTESQRELMRSPAVWWIFTSATFLAILPAVLSLNFLSDALQQALSPAKSGSDA